MIAHCESTHATMARRLRGDMDEFTCNVARCGSATKEIKTTRKTGVRLAGDSRRVTPVACIHRPVKPLDGRMVVANPYLLAKVDTVLFGYRREIKSTVIRIRSATFQNLRGICIMKGGALSFKATYIQLPTAFPPPCLALAQKSVQKSSENHAKSVRIEARGTSRGRCGALLGFPLAQRAKNIQNVIHGPLSGARPRPKSEEIYRLTPLPPTSPDSDDLGIGCFR